MTGRITFMVLRKYSLELRERATRTGVEGAGWPGVGQGRGAQDR